MQLLAQAVELPGGGEGIGHGVQPIEHERTGRDVAPDCPGREVRGGLQGEAGGIGRPGQNHIGAGGSERQLRRKGDAEHGAAPCRAAA